MRRAALVAFATVAVAGIAIIGVMAATDRRSLAFTLGVVPGQVAAAAAPHRHACQRPVVVEQGFSAIRFQAEAQRRPTGPLDVTVSRVTGARVLARGQLSRVPRGRTSPTARLDRQVPTGASVSVCVRNRGRTTVWLYGGPAVARARTGVYLNGRPKPRDMALVFERRRPRSALGLVPEMFRRASLFRPGWVGAWTFWALLVLVLAGVPALLAVALRDAVSELSELSDDTSSA